MKKPFIIALLAVCAMLLWAQPAAAQTPTITPTATIAPTATATPTITMTMASSSTWMFPEGGLQPISYTTPTDTPLSELITGEDIWQLARVGLTTYTLLDLTTWGFLALVLLIPTAIGLVYKIFTNPPEI